MRDGSTRGPLDKEFLPMERRILSLSSGGQRGVLVLRLILAAVLVFEALEASGARGRTPWIAALPGAYGAAVAFLYYLRKTKRLSDSWGPGTFLLDVGASLAVLRLAEGSGSHVYTALLLVILGSCFLQKPLFIFTVSLSASLAYAFLAFPSAEDIPRVLPLHLSLFLLIALFAVHIADYASLIEQQTARRYEERLAWMQRLSMVGRAMAAVLHEAKTPLGTIVLNAEAASDMLAKGKKPHAELGVISAEADHATAILQNFLDFVKPTRLELAPLRLHEPLLQAIGMLKIRLDEGGVALDVAVPNDCPVRGSSRHLLQAFTNLLNNAVDAMPSGGKLSVEMEKRAGKVLVRFKDTGLGMSRQSLDSVFEPFTTSKSGEEGHGLGLSIVRWIAVEHGGDVKIESKGPGTGAQVTLILPMAHES